MANIDMMNIEKIVFVDASGVEMAVNEISVEKIDSIINEYLLIGHVGNENCSGADVGINFRSVPNDCAEKGRACCSLPKNDRTQSTEVQLIKAETASLAKELKNKMSLYFDTSADDIIKRLFQLSSNNPTLEDPQ